jgi:hypothetical protein
MMLCADNLCSVNFVILKVMYVTRFNFAVHLMEITGSYATAIG